MRRIGWDFNNPLKSLFLIIIGNILLFTGGLQAQQDSQIVQPDPEELSAARSYYLDGLLKSHDYVPGKNSYIIQGLKRGERKTILNLTGDGSVRHLWATWSLPGGTSSPPDAVFIRVYVDGSSAPSIAGTIGEICRAARATGKRFVPFPAFHYKDAYNLYLPIFFGKSVWIEIEAKTDVEEFFTQVDYRTDVTAHTSARLVSEVKDTGLTLTYRGRYPEVSASHSFTSIARKAVVPLHCDFSGKACSATVNGPGILRKFALSGDFEADTQLSIYWDGEEQPSILAPLRYFFADFINTALEAKPGYFACNFPMPFFRSARIELRSATKLPAHAELYTWIEHRRPSARSPYFHALYHEQKTVGYLQYPVLQVRGEGFFVGINLFDSGHNHGGGDTAFIDGGTAHPRLLHGICGEDYFGFAWHHTGAMTPLTGAPAHERRYRLHFENPYPFHESFQLSFGAFAGLHPKSVAFWYQFPNHSTVKNLRVPDIPWKVLGPLSMDDTLRDAPSDQKYQTVIPFKEPLTLSADWQNVDMNSGSLDLTYHFRHYALTEKGSGYVPGKSKYSLVTYVYSQAGQRVRATLGHDDALLIRLNGQTIADMGPQEGFHAAEVLLPLHAGWNKLNLIVWNDENVNWRWAGISLALEDRGSRLNFASEE